MRNQREETGSSLSLMAISLCLSPKGQMFVRRESGSLLSLSLSVLPLPPRKSRKVEFLQREREVSIHFQRSGHCCGNNTLLSMDIEAQIDGGARIPVTFVQRCDSSEFVGILT